MTSQAHRAHPIILAQAHGRCPLNLTPGVAAKGPCGHSRAGNGVIGVFPTQKHAWGISYAFNCGTHPGGFYVVVGLPSMDGQLQDTGFYRHGKQGRGYVTETGKGQSTLKAIPTIWNSLENVEIRSACAWHVLAVKGPPSAVAATVPRVPKYR